MEGNSNKLARTAGVSIANEPGKTIFNPLFVYGQSGVGKTHLANAIGVMAKQLHPEKRILYVSANTFQIQYTDAVRANTVNDFLNFYQTIDVLIVDDIQEFAGKTGTQNTFFHIFNHLHQTGKQLVLTSDRSPVVMVGLEQRLLTRFKWGLSAEIEKPDFQLRKAILENKIYRDGLEIPADVVDFIAENVTDNVRDLEGTLVSLLAHSTLADMHWVEVFHIWMLGMVMQWSGKNRMHGNCLIPILVNPLQGLKKSTFCRSLLPPALRGYYTDDFDVTREGDALRKMRSLALINIDEFNRMEEGKLARLKNLVQMSGLSMRRPFQSSYSQQPRLSSFIGTSNFCDLLTDSSGNCRFYPVMTKGSIRLPRINYKQLYAQLRDELKHNRRYWLSPKEEQAVSLRNDAFLRRPIEESLFYSCFSLPRDEEKFQRWTIGQIYEVMKKASPETMRDVKMRAFGKHLALMGVKKLHTRYGDQYLLNRL
jgi:hypothetical protein